jgi:predicted dithiol-disulfide oxidoreductase (DUF899 family)
MAERTDPASGEEDVRQEEQVVGAVALPPVVSEQEWQAARARLLMKEKAATHALDVLAAERRRLPMVQFASDYVFVTPDGGATLLDLFEGRRQLVVYQFMDNGPDEYCPGCTTYTDNTDAPRGRENLHRRNTTYVTVSDMPLEQIEAYKESRGWTVPFYSSRGSTFSEDCGAGKGFGLSVFLRDGADVHRSYFTNGRGVDRLRLDMNLLDLTPLGRQEDWEDTPDSRPRREAQFDIRTVDDRPA